MKLLVGLGNPGRRYLKSRHNIGFMVIDRILSDILMVSPHQVKKYHALVYYRQSKDLLFTKPLTSMNSSGKTVGIIVNQYKLKTSDLWVIYDDLDLTLGAYKIQKGKGPKDHKGLLSIYKNIGKKDFWHVRIGVDNRDTKDRIGGEDYVLQNFRSGELIIINSVIVEVIEELQSRVLD